MKNKSIVLSTILILLLLISGGSMAWFSSGTNVINEFKMGTVEVEVKEPGFEPIEGAEEDVIYTKNVQVKSTGSKNTYVRVRIVPYWDENPSLPVSNVQLNLANNSDWVDNTAVDGYYYFKYYLEEGQETSLLLQSVTFTELGPEYEGETLTLKVVAEGVQITNGAWKHVWNLEELPFTPNQPWIPPTAD